MARSHNFRTFALLLAVALAAGGCSSNSGITSFKVTPVKGKVTLGTEPLADASVTLIMQGPGPEGFAGAGATTDAQGNFEITTGSQKGVPAGTYKVTVSKVVGPDGKPIVNDPASGQMVDPSSLTELVPPAFNDPKLSTVNLTVTEGTPVPELKIEISSQGNSTGGGNPSIPAGD